MTAPDSLKEITVYHRRMAAVMCGVCLVVAAALVLVQPNDMSLAGGFVLGAAARLVKFGFIDIAVIRKIAAERRDAAATQLKAMVVWMAIFAAAAFGTIKLGFNIWALVAGLFLPQLVLMADTWLRPNLFARAGDSSDPDIVEEDGE